MRSTGIVSLTITVRWLRTPGRMTQADSTLGEALRGLEDPGASLILEGRRRAGSMRAESCRAG